MMMMMIKSLFLASLVTCAAAFAPHQSQATTHRASVTARNAESGMEAMPGSIDARGKEFKFDPLNLSETYAPMLPYFRESEVRHCRTAMLAVVGFIVPDFIRIPGDMYSFENVPKTADAHDALMGSGPMGQLVLWIGLWELVVQGPATIAAMNGEREPGDFGLTLFKPKDDATYKKRVDQELLNGRLAMMAVGGIATQSVLTGHGFPYV